MASYYKLLGLLYLIAILALVSLPFVAVYLLWEADLGPEESTIIILLGVAVIFLSKRD